MFAKTPVEAAQSVLVSGKDDVRDRMTVLTRSLFPPGTSGHHASSKPKSTSGGPPLSASQAIAFTSHHPVAICTSAVTRPRPHHPCAACSTVTRPRPHHPCAACSTAAVSSPHWPRHLQPLAYHGGGDLTAGLATRAQRAPQGSAATVGYRA
jgi:hypothetical protein